MKDLLSNVGSGGGGAAPAAGGAAAGGDAPAEAAKEEAKEEGAFPQSLARVPSRDGELTRSTEKEESDDDMGFGLFD